MDSLESNLWDLFKRHLPDNVDYQRIETGGTGKGVPDVNICDMGRDFWVELKMIDGNKIRKLKPEQIAWHWKRTRVGGKTWFLARKKTDKVDQIYLWSGHKGPDLLRTGIFTEGGTMWEAPFDWNAIVAAVLRRGT